MKTGGCVSLIQAEPGDIIRLYWPACYAKLISISKNSNSTHYIITFETICTSNYRFYKKPRIKTKTVYSIPKKVDIAFFNDLLDKIFKLRSMIK